MLIFIIVGSIYLTLNKVKLFKKYYMPKVMFKDGKVAMEFYTYPFHSKRYIKHNWVNDKDIFYSEWASDRLMWLDKNRKQKNKTNEEIANDKIQLFLESNHPKVYDDLYVNDDNDDIEIFTYNKIQVEKLKKYSKELEKLINIDDEEQYLNEYNKLKNRENY